MVIIRKCKKCKEYFDVMEGDMNTICEDCRGVQSPIHKAVPTQKSMKSISRNSKEIDSESRKTLSHEEYLMTILFQ